MNIQPEDLAGVSSHPSEDVISGIRTKNKKEDKKSKYLFTYEDVRTHLINRLSINVVPTHAFYTYYSNRYREEMTLEFYTGDLVRWYIQPSRGIGHWENGIILQGDGRFVQQSYKIDYTGELTLGVFRGRIKSVSKDKLAPGKTKFYLEYSYLKGEKL